MNIANTKQLSSLIFKGISATVLGLLVLSSPLAFTALLLLLFGVLLIVAGVFVLYHITKKKNYRGLSLLGGTGLLATGIFMISSPEMATYILDIILGIAFLPSGLLLIYIAFRLRNLKEEWLLSLAIGIFSLTTSLWMLAFPTSGIFTFVLASSIGFLISGFFMILIAMKKWRLQNEQV